ncbi:MAG: hypothetical protein GF400_03250 [Candidatus Eisenbacteria bacterium]|nr:hypothetical protein [Candidatus Eisenbacteria bacterium]
MLRNLTLTSMETDATEFTVSYWKLDPGDSVAEGDEVLVVESVDEKTALTVTSPFSGTLVEVVAGEETSVRPGDLLGRFEVK